jgi:hypothetical protein
MGGEEPLRALEMFAKICLSPDALLADFLTVCLSNW